MKNNTVFSKPVVQAAALMLAGLALLPAPSQADTYSWGLSTAGTWNTSATNWITSGTPNVAWVNGSGNDAVFNGFASNTTITVGTNILANSLSTSGSGGPGTISFNGSPLDVTTINTTSAPIDMFSVLTGNHGFTYNSTGAGRLNLKNAANYTGATSLTGSAFILSDNNNNVLPTATTLSLGATTTFRMAASKSQQVGLLAGNGLVLGQGSAGNVNTFTINTGLGASGTFSGTIRNNSDANDTLHLVVSGSGSQTLSGVNSYNGSTTVSSGRLILGSNLTKSSSVTVSGGKLESNVANVNLGVGTVSMSSGTLSAGGDGIVGQFTVAANQDFSATGGAIIFDLDSTASFDRFLGSGAGGDFSLTNTTLTLNLLSWTGTDYANTYTIFSGFNSGTISNLAITGYDTANYTASLGSNGTLSFTAVPEPTIGILLSAGLLGILVLRRLTPMRR